jgi:hypothetical protein
VTVFFAGFAIGLACAMWIRWDQTLALKEELDATQRHNNTRRWHGIYRHTQPDALEGHTLAWWWEQPDDVITA